MISGFRQLGFLNGDLLIGDLDDGRSWDLVSGVQGVISRYNYGYLDYNPTH